MFVKWWRRQKKYRIESLDISFKLITNIPASRAKSRSYFKVNFRLFLIPAYFAWTTQSLLYSLRSRETSCFHSVEYIVSAPCYTISWEESEIEKASWLLFLHPATIWNGVHCVLVNIRHGVYSSGITERISNQFLYTTYIIRLSL